MPHQNPPPNTQPFFTRPFTHGLLIVVESFLHFVDFYDYSRGVHRTLKAFSWDTSSYNFPTFFLDA